MYRIPLTNTITLLNLHNKLFMYCLHSKSSLYLYLEEYLHLSTIFDKLVFPLKTLFGNICYAFYMERSTMGPDSREITGISNIRISDVGISDILNACYPVVAYFSPFQKVKKMHVNKGYIIRYHYQIPLCLLVMVCKMTGFYI